MRYALWVAVLFVVVLGACTSDGGEPAASTTVGVTATATPEATPRVATPTPAPRRTPTPGAVTPTPTVTAAPFVLPPDVRTLEVGAPVGFLAGVAILALSGCVECDGPPSGVQRLTLAADGSVTREDVIGEEGASTGVRGSINGYAISPDGASMAVSVCTRGSCGGINWPSEPEVAILWSNDGGWSWTETARLDNPLIPVAADGARVIVSDWYEPGPPPECIPDRYRVLPEDVVLVVPEPGLLGPFAAPQGIVWSKRDGSFVNGAGEAAVGGLALDIAASQDDANVLALHWRSDDGPLAIVWQAAGENWSRWLVTAIGKGGEEMTLDLDKQSVQFGGWLGPDQLATTTLVQDGEGRPRITLAVLDLTTATIHPMLLNGTDPISVRQPIAVVPLRD